MGGVHKAKDPKVPKVHLRNLSGEMEPMWVFKSDDNYRKLRITTVLGECKSTHVLEPEQHLHQEQGLLSLNHAMKARLAESQLSELLQKNPCLSTMEEYKEKLQKKSHTSGGGLGGVLALLTAEGSEDAAREEEEKESEEGAENEKDEDDDDARSDDTDDAWGDGAAGAVSTEIQRAKVQPAAYSTPMAKKVPKKKWKDGAIKRLASGSILGNAKKSVASVDRDEDMEGATPSEAASATVKTGVSTASALESANKWIEKLPLLSIIGGKKLGVINNHAQTQAAKMQNKEKFRLLAHLKLVKDAQCLSPEGLETSDKTSIYTALEALKETLEGSFPQHIESKLFNMCIEDKLAATSTSQSKDVFHSLWVHIRPYKLPHEDAKVDLKSPCLSKLSFDAAAKKLTFEEALISKLLDPIILQGESRQLVLKTVLQQILEQLSEDLLEEIDEVYVTTLCDLQTSVKGLLGTLSKDANEMLDVSEEIKELGNCKTESIVCHLGNVFTSVPYYAQLHADAVKLLVALDFHAQELKTLQAFIKSEDTCGAIQYQACADRLRDLAMLDKELPPDMVAEWRGEMKTRALALWSHFKAEMAKAEEVAEVAVGMQMMLAECSITFPEDFQNAHQELQDLLAEKCSQKQMDKLSAAIKELVLDMKDKCEDEAFLKATVEHLRVARGGLASEELQVDMKKCCDFLCNAALHHVGASTDEKSIVGVQIECVNSIQPWLIGDAECVKKAEKLIKMIKIKSSMQKFNALGASMAERLEKADPALLLPTIMRGTESMASDSLAWAEDLQKKLMEEASSIVAGAKTEVLGTCKGVLSTELENAKPMSGGTRDASGKEAWDDGLGGSVGYEALLARAKECLMTLSKTEIAQLEKQKMNLAKVFLGRKVFKQVCLPIIALCKKSQTHGKALDGYTDKKKFFNVDGQDEIEIEAAAMISKIARTKCTGMLFHTLSSNDDKMAKRKKCQLIVRQAEGLDLRQPLLQKAMKAISMSDSKPSS
eukprot:6492258-Amphidinium_carterae.2